jgi:hypothetical protein
MEVINFQHHERLSLCNLCTCSKRLITVTGTRRPNSQQTSTLLFQRSDLPRHSVKTKEGKDVQVAWKLGPPTLNGGGDIGIKQLTDMCDEYFEVRNKCLKNI